MNIYTLTFFFTMMIFIVLFLVFRKKIVSVIAKDELKGITAVRAVRIPWETYHIDKKDTKKDIFGNSVHLSEYEWNHEGKGFNASFYGEDTYIFDVPYAEGAGNDEIDLLVNAKTGKPVMVRDVALNNSKVIGLFVISLIAGLVLAYFSMKIIG
ncbi:MAG: hypothetical protein IKN92_05375 [Clostridia bacterium]|nr:hypothetical protein [Clostridia bacterium]